MTDGINAQLPPIFEVKIYTMQDGQEEQVDITNLKYALYVRKSTNDKVLQQRSTDDQIAECEELAAKLGIRLAKL